jgi:Mn2+/Fe2+ NRAMP family transporter
VTGILFTVVISGEYWTFEKITLFFCTFNFVYIPAALWAMKTPSAPSWNEAIRGFYHPDLPLGLTGDLIFIIMANIGTTIAPWMLFFQQSSVVDKGLQEKDISFGQWDTAIGSFLTVIVATFLIIVCAKLLPGKPVESAAEAAIQIMPMNKYVGMIIAIGLFDAGFLGAICISLASSWAFGEVFGWAHSLNNKIREAPWFYALYALMLGSAGMEWQFSNASFQGPSGGGRRLRLQPSLGTTFPGTEAGASLASDRQLANRLRIVP